MTDHVSSAVPATARQIAARRPIACWLLTVAGLIFLMVIVGGATRLTESGLSITEWQPVTGAVPPLSEEAWQSAFEKYRQIPEYQLVNKGMSLAEFKYIYWWEWAHRFLGRFIGVAFFVPFVFFLITSRIERQLIPRLGAMFLLGGAQGAMGWYMVMSGLVDRVDVSQYRLTVHLGLAFAIFAYIFWVALDLLRGTLGQALRMNAVARRALGLSGLIFLQILLGGLVAGLRAGHAYNTWPLMDGRIVPRGLLDHVPWWINFFENHITVQFDHRMLAYGILAFAFYHLVTLKNAARPVKLSGHGVMGGLLLQVLLGIWTLLAVVPIPLGVLHQAGAMVVLALALFHTHLAARPGAHT